MNGDWYRPDAGEEQAAERRERRARKSVRRASERPTWLPVEHQIGGTTYKVYPSGTVYRMVGKSQERIHGADAAYVLRAVVDKQREANDVQGQ